MTAAAQWTDNYCIWEPLEGPLILPLLCLWLHQYVECLLVACYVGDLLYILSVAALYFCIYIKEEENQPFH